MVGVRRFHRRAASRGSRGHLGVELGSDGSYMLAINRLTRSSTDRKGSLHSTVRCA